MPLYTSLVLAPQPDIRAMVESLEEAVGTNIQEDISQNNLETWNSVPARIWDYLSTNLVKNIQFETCTVFIANRKIWKFPVVYDRFNKCIYTFMREERFKDLQRQSDGTKGKHYLSIFTRRLNNDLFAGTSQLHLFPQPSASLNQLQEQFRNIVPDWQNNVPDIQYHVLVLFEAAEYQLNSVRAVLITPDFEIAKDSEQDWTAFIRGNMGLIPEKIDNPEEPANQPSKKLKLTAKALRRQNKNLKVRTEDQSEQQNC